MEINEDPTNISFIAFLYVDYLFLNFSKHLVVMQKQIRKLNGKLKIHDDRENPGELAILWIVSLMVEEMHFMRNATCTKQFCS